MILSIRNARKIVVVLILEKRGIRTSAGKVVNIFDYRHIMMAANYFEIYRDLFFAGHASKIKPTLISVSECFE